MKKLGPKGPWKIKGNVLKILIREHENNPAKSSEWLSQRILEEMRTQVTSRAIRYFLRERKKGRSYEAVQEIMRLA